MFCYFTDKEIALDPELTQDLLDILNDEDMEEDEGDAQLEQYEGAVAAAAAYVGSFKEVPKAHEDYLDAEPMDSEFYSCDDENEGGKDFSGDIEDDPEMAEMLKMLEDAKGDLEGAQDEDLEQLMQSFDSQDQERKKSLKRPPAADQQVPEIEKKAKTLDETILRPIPSFLSGIAIAPDAEEQGVSFESEAKVETIATMTKGMQINKQFQSVFYILIYLIDFRSCSTSKK